MIDVYSLVKKGQKIVANKSYGKFEVEYRTRYHKIWNIFPNMSQVFLKNYKRQFVEIEAIANQFSF